MHKERKKERKEKEKIEDSRLELLQYVEKLQNYKPIMHSSCLIYQLK